MPLSPRPHLDVRQWLNVLDLGQYASVFEKFEGVEVSRERTFFNNNNNNIIIIIIIIIIQLMTMFLLLLIYKSDCLLH
jgi:hypothetical protein